MLYSIQTAATLAKTMEAMRENGSDWNSPAHLPQSLCFEFKQIQAKLFSPSAAKEKSGEYPCGCRHLGSRLAAGSAAGTAKLCIQSQTLKEVQVLLRHSNMRTA